MSAVLVVLRGLEFLAELRLLPLAALADLDGGDVQLARDEIGENVGDEDSVDGALKLLFDRGLREACKLAVRRRDRWRIGSR